MKDLRFVALMAVTVTLAFAGAASSQTKSKDTSKPAANAWMLTPTPDLAWNQDIPASVRAQRDSYWGSLSFRRVPLTAPSGVGRGVDRATFSADDPEIPDRPNRAVLTATFTKHRSVLSASEYSLYTEVTLHIEEVFEDRTGSGRPVAQKDITLLLPGGTVALRSGEILSDDIVASDMFFEPEHKYLLVMSYHQEGDFYTFADDWDISDGTVRPNTERAPYLATSGRSSLSGITVQQLGPALERPLHGQKQERRRARVEGLALRKKKCRPPGNEGPASSLL